MSAITKSILYLHGFASSGHGTKARFFREKFKAGPQTAFHAIDFNPTPADFEYMTVTGQINRLRQYILSQKLERIKLIGSSMGALVALHYAHRFSGVGALLLLAPALCYRADRYPQAELQQWQEEETINIPHYAFEQDLPLRYGFHTDGLQYQQTIPPAVPTLIIHGRNDDVVPIAGSRQYAADFPDTVQLIEVDSDHRLNDQLDLIWEYGQSFLLAGDVT